MMDRNTGASVGPNGPLATKYSRDECYDAMERFARITKWSLSHETAMRFFVLPLIDDIDHVSFIWFFNNEVYPPAHVTYMVWEWWSLSNFGEWQSPPYGRGTDEYARQIMNVLEEFVNYTATLEESDESGN
jgi:hypothetical protein